MDRHDATRSWITGQEAEELYWMGPFNLWFSGQKWIFVGELPIWPLLFKPDHTLMQFVRALNGCIFASLALTQTCWHALILLQHTLRKPDQDVSKPPVFNPKCHFLAWRGICVGLIAQMQIHSVLPAWGGHLNIYSLNDQSVKGQHRQYAHACLQRWIWI